MPHHYLRGGRAFSPGSPRIPSIPPLPPQSQQPDPDSAQDGRQERSPQATPVSSCRWWADGGTWGEWGTGEKWGTWGK